MTFQGVASPRAAYGPGDRPRKPRKKKPAPEPDVVRTSFYIRKEYIDILRIYARGAGISRDRVIEEAIKRLIGGRR